MNQQYPQQPRPDLPYPGEHQRPVAIVPMPPTAWKSAPATVRFAVWVWAIGVIASLAGAAAIILLFVLGMNLAILGGH